MKKRPGLLYSVVLILLMLGLAGLTAVGGEKPQPNLIHKVDPVYPPEAKEKGVEGVVKLEVIIGRDGSPKQVQVASGDPVLAEAAVTAVQQWRWEPTLLNGKPVEVKSTVQLNFTLKKDK